MLEQVRLERARTDRRHIVLSEGNDGRVLAVAVIPPGMSPPVMLDPGDA